MSTTASAIAAAREQSEDDELIRVAAAAMAVTTREVSSVGGGGGGRYAPLTQYQVEQVRTMWADVTEEDMAKLLAIPRRLEERQRDEDEEEAKRAAKENKQNRRDEVDELAEAIAGGGAVGGNSGKLRARDANVPSEAPAATGSDAKRARVDGAGRGTALEKEVVGTAGDGENEVSVMEVPEYSSDEVESGTPGQKMSHDDGDDEVSVIQVPEYSSDEVESGLDIAKEDHQRRGHGEEDAPGEEGAHGEEDAHAKSSSGKRCFADVRVRGDADSEWLHVVKLEP